SNSEPWRDKADEIHVPGEEQRAPSLSDRFPRLASIQNPGPRSASNPSLSDASPEFRLRLDNLPWPRPNSIFTTFDS
ncbi:hypothetical protein A2U01_0074919, partial [Trifolium medium]|nr:hypothetical protein [Trifolium medium]